MLRLAGAARLSWVARSRADGEGVADRCIGRAYDVDCAPRVQHDQAVGPVEARSRYPTRPLRAETDSSCENACCVTGSRFGVPVLEYAETRPMRHDKLRMHRKNEVDSTGNRSRTVTASPRWRQVRTNWSTTTASLGATGDLWLQTSATNRAIETIAKARD